MNQLTQQLIKVNIVDIPARIRQDFLLFARTDATFRSLFIREPKSEKMQSRIEDSFRDHIYAFNKGRRGANNWKTIQDEYKLPEDIYVCAKTLGYKWKRWVLESWKYLSSQLREDGLQDIYEWENLPNTIAFVLQSTVALVETVYTSKNSQEQETLMLHLRQLLQVLRVNMKRTPNDESIDLDSTLARLREKAKWLSVSDNDTEKILNVVRMILSHIH
jgi:hypothetical protein